MSVRERMETLIEGKALPIGSKRTWGKKEMVKTHGGWKPIATKDTDPEKIQAEYQAIAMKYGGAPEEMSTDDQEKAAKVLARMTLKDLHKEQAQQARLRGMLKGKQVLNHQTPEQLARTMKFMDVYDTIVSKAIAHNIGHRTERMESLLAEKTKTTYILKNHNGTVLGKFTDIKALTNELLKYEGQTGNKTTIEIKKDE